MIPTQLTAGVLAVTAGPLGYLPPLLAIALLVLRGMHDESPVTEPYRWSPPRTAPWLITGVVTIGFAVLAIRLAALAT